MGHAMFYHLTHSSADALVQLLVPRAMGQGWRIAIRSPQRETLNRLDNLLWEHPEDGFVPHALSNGTAADADQPVLLTQDHALPNGARYLLALDGADISASETALLERACLVFDATDAAQMTHARGLWKTLTAAGVAAQYWSEESGSWAMKVEKKA